jgi:hypothetical protein
VVSSDGLPLPVTGTEEPGERGVLRDGEAALRETPTAGPRRPVRDPRRTGRLRGQIGHPVLELEEGRRRTALILGAD